MRVPFYKYQATGNDFVIINQWEQCYLREPDQSVVARLCDRRFGVGADGCMLLERDEHALFRMIYYNADGALSTMCGNGGRAIAHLAHRLGLVFPRGNFVAVDGIHDYEILPDMVRLGMCTVSGLKMMGEYYFLNTGSPHVVQIVDDVSALDVVKMGSTIRYSSQFGSSGTNVNFVQLGKDKIYVRTYERGVEDETLSCGTGVTAAAIVVAALDSRFNGQQGIRVQTKGGDLRVSFTRHIDSWFDIYLEGPAVLSFEGSIDL